MVKRGFEEDYWRVTHLRLSRAGGRVLAGTNLTIRNYGYHVSV